MSQSSHKFYGVLDGAAEKLAGWLCPVMRTPSSSPPIRFASLGRDKIHITSGGLMTPQLSIITPKVTINKNKAVTTSKDVADYFGKEHQKVVLKISNLDCSERFLTSNFWWVKFEHKGNTYDAYEMTKDGFVFLVMGFTGKKAAQFKEDYITEFNRVEAQLRHAIAVTGTTNKVLLTLFSNGKVNSARVIHDNEYVASLDTLFEIGRRAGYMIIHKDELIKKLSE
ncbi:MAG: Rha family transcriptional regulator [Candidatus Phlomobacter fragariae]